MNRNHVHQRYVVTTLLQPQFRRVRPFRRRVTSNRLSLVCTLHAASLTKRLPRFSPADFSHTSHPRVSPDILPCLSTLIVCTRMIIVTTSNSSRDITVYTNHHLNSFTRRCHAQYLRPRHLNTW